jgi:uncharacterized protein (TIGR02246 family)
VPASARQTIAAANAEWLMAMKRRDPHRIAAAYAEDAVLIVVTGEAVQGRAAIEQFMRDRFARSSLV